MPESSEPSSLRAQQVAQTRAALVAAGRRLFGQNGFRDTSVDDLAREARVTTGALYHHFPTKTALFEAVFEQAHMDMMSASTAAAKGAKDGLDELALGFDAFLDGVLQPDVQRILVLDGPAVLGLARYTELDEQYAYAVIVGSLQQAADAGTIQIDDPETATRLLLGALTRGAMLIANSANPGEDTTRGGQVDARSVEQLHPLGDRSHTAELVQFGPTLTSARMVDVMTRPLRRWDPFRPLDMLASLWSTAAVAPVSTGAAAAYRTLFMTLRRLVVGRELSVRLDDGDITLTVTEFDSRLDVRGLAVGQLSDVRLAACDIRWDNNRLDRATAVLHNVHLRPSAPPVLIAAPVDLTVELPAAALDDLFRLAAPRLAGEIGEDGIARLRLARRPALGHLEVDAHLDGSTLWLKPRGLIVRSKRLRLPQRTPAYPVHLPELPHGLQLTDISIEPDKLCLSGTLQEWRIDVPRTRLEDVINQLSVVGRPLNLTRRGRG